MARNSAGRTVLSFTSRIVSGATRCAAFLVPALFLSAHGIAEAGPFTVLESGPAGIVLEYASPEPVLDDVDTPFGMFQALTLPDHAHLEEPGRPNLPARGAGFAVPDGTRPRMSVEILESTVLPGLRPLPARLEEARPDPAFYGAGGSYPDESVVLRDLGHLRHYRVGQVSVRPLRYDGARGTVTRIVRARIRVTFEPAPESPRVTSPVPLVPLGEEPAWEDTYRNVLVNYDAARRFRTRAVPRAPAMRAPGEAAAGEPEFRVYVERSGIYTVTYARLAAEGWPAGIPVGRIRLYEKSLNPANPSSPLVREIPIRIEEGAAGQAGIFDGDDVFYMYGQGFMDRFQPRVEQARYTRLHVYWVSWSEAGGARMSVTPGWFEAPGFTTPAMFYQTTHYEEDAEYIYYGPSEGAISGQTSPIDTHYWLPQTAFRDSLPFDTPGRVVGTSARIRARWQGIAGGTHYISLWLTRNCAAPSDTMLLNRFPFDGINRLNYDSGITIPAARLADGCNRLKIQGNGFDPNDPNSQGSGAFFNSFDVGYSRRYEAVNGRLRFNSGTASGNVEFSIDGLGQRELYVFDVTDSLNPRAVDLSGASIAQVSPPPSPKFRLRFRADITAPRTYELYTASGIPDLEEAVRPDRFPRAITSKVLVRNEPEDAALDTGADVLVICHPQFRAELDRWVAHREAQGRRIKVVSPQAIWNQFSGGDMSVPALREWLRWTYRNWAAAPDYLLLFGDASEDHRNDRPASKTNWVPTQMAFSPDVFGPRELVGSEGYFVGALAPGDNELNLLPEMHMGRLSVGSVEEARVVVDKLIAYDTYAPGDTWRNRGLIVSDDIYSNPVRGGASYCYDSRNLAFERGADSARVELGRNACLSDFSVEEFRMSAWLDTLRTAPRTLMPGDCANLSATQAYTVSTLRSLWLTATNRGHLFQVFSGHGNKGVMTSENLVEFIGQFSDPRNRTVEQLANNGRPFIFIGLACHLNEFEYFDEMRTQASIAERMVLLPNAGAIASIASTAYENIFVNAPLEQYLVRSMFTDLPVDPDSGRPRRYLGEGKDMGIVRLILEFDSGTTTFGSLPQSYILLGDPTMPIDMAPPRLSVTAGGQPVTAGSPVVAEPGGSSLTISARLDDDVATGLFSIRDDSTTVPASAITVTPVREGACRASRLTYTAEVKPASYVILLRATDWLGRPLDFPLAVRLGVEYRVNGVRVDPGQDVPVDGSYTVRVESPAPLTAERIEVTVNGEGGRFTVTQADEAGRVFTAENSGPLPGGTVRLETRIDGRPARSDGAAVQLNVQSEASLQEVWFYPNPWEGGGTAFFTYQLNYLAGERPRRATIAVFSVGGRRVRNLDAPVELGRNRLDWDLRDGRGDVVANGVYLWKLSVETASGRMLSRIERIVVHR